MTTPSRVFRAAFLVAIIGLVSCGENLPPVSDGISLPDARGMNVIVISFDALRPRSLGAYGYERDTSPNIDAFAAESLVLDDVQNTANSTPSSFASTWSGFLPLRVFRGWRLEDTDTMAETFAAGGYSTAAFINNVQVTDQRNFGQGFQAYTVYIDTDRDRRVLDDVRNWLRDGPQEPFFLWVHFVSPHGPYEVRDMSSQFYDPDYRGPYRESSGRNAETDDPEDIRRIVDLYDGEVFFADYLFGELWGEIQSLGLEQNSIVVLTADHGEAMHEHGFFGHHRLYQPVVQVPLILYHPLAEGQRSGIPAQNIDLFPTLAGLAGLDAPQTDGLNLRNGVPEDRIRITVGMTNRKYHGMSMLQGSEKFMAYCMPFYTEELYDLASDPGETTNILTERVARVEEMLVDLAGIVGTDPCSAIIEAVQNADQTEGLDEDVIRQLRTLGYVQ